VGYSEYRIGDQPCGNFTSIDDEWFGSVRHVCPLCHGFRMFCDVCCKDHYANGWENCHKIIGENQND